MLRRAYSRLLHPYFVLTCPLLYISGYVQQMDTHLPSATVREALLFSAQLRQPASVSIEEKEAYVDKCLQMCGLEEYADAIVGSLGVEQRKRTTIGVELVAKVRYYPRRYSIPYSHIRPFSHP